jgi:L-asparaginase
MKDILFIMTGGTIDAEPYPNPASPPRHAIALKDSVVPDAVAALGLAGDCRFFQWMMKDSKDFTKDEIYALSVFVRQRRAMHIVITHGTDRMAEAARELSRLLKDSGKVVALTGAMVPLTNGAASDAYENLRFVIGEMETWQPGVYVVMHGRRFEAGRVRKNFTTMQFEEVDA